MSDQSGNMPEGGKVVTGNEANPPLIDRNKALRSWAPPVFKKGDRVLDIKIGVIGIYDALVDNDGSPFHRVEMPGSGLTGFDMFDIRDAAEAMPLTETQRPLTPEEQTIVKAMDRKVAPQGHPSGHTSGDTLARMIRKEAPIIRTGDVVEFTAKDGPPGRFMVQDVAGKDFIGEPTDQVRLVHHGWIPTTLVRKVTPANGDLTGTPGPGPTVTFAATPEVALNAQITHHYDVMVKVQNVSVAWILHGTDKIEFVQDPTKDQLMGAIYHLMRVLQKAVVK
jgi:hypothetical protein